MFTGIVQAMGAIVRVEPRGGDTRLVVDTVGLDASDIAIGDSICVSGVCLTALDVEARRFAADVSNETLSRTTLGGLSPGAAVNLEKSLRLADRLGGHLVSGHVVAVGGVAAIAGSEYAAASRPGLGAPDELDAVGRPSEVALRALEQGESAGPTPAGEGDEAPDPWRDLPEEGS